MRHLVVLLVSALVLTGCATLSPGGEGAVIRAKNRVSPALVHIRPVKEVFKGGKREEMVVMGSGFIITRDGYVVTNEHVAGDSKLVRCVLWNKEEVEAEVVGTDRYTDIAVLKLQTDLKSLPTVEFGRSDSLEAGQTVLALGSPHGLSRSVSKGIVSVTDRYLGTGEQPVAPYNNWIQTDAAINQGNSGGPLVNLKGEVVGVNARRLRGADNVGFAIPVDIARGVVEQIIATGRVQRSWIGINLQETLSRTDDPDARGVVIADVDPLGPAAAAGVKPGDVMVAVDGEPTDARFIEDLSPVRNVIANLPVGEEAKLTVVRGDEEVEIAVATAERGDLIGNQIELGDWGFTVAELTPELARRAQLPTRIGVRVTGVQVGGAAATARLQNGDILLEIDEIKIENLSSFEKLVDERVTSEQEMVLFKVKRGALTRFALLKQDGGEVDEMESTDPGGLAIENGGGGSNE